MAIFNGYVRLPEGIQNSSKTTLFQSQWIIMDPLGPPKYTQLFPTPPVPVATGLARSREIVRFIGSSHDLSRAAGLKGLKGIQVPKMFFSSGFDAHSENLDNLKKIADCYTHMQVYDYVIICEYIYICLCINTHPRPTFV